MRKMLLPAVASGTTLVALFFAGSRLQVQVIAVLRMISQVCDAFIAAGAPARKAAEALAPIAKMAFRGSTSNSSFSNGWSALPSPLNVAILTRPFSC